MKSKKKKISPADTKRFYKWLEIDCMEINYLPERGSGTPPKIHFVSSLEDYLKVIANCPADMMVTAGINPRKPSQKRSAKNNEIPSLQSFYFDVESNRSRKWDDRPTNAEKQITKEFIDLVLIPYLTKRGFQKPVVASSGSFYHLYFAIESIDTRKEPDVGKKLAAFYKEVIQHLSDELAQRNLKIDGTFDLRRVAKVSGTSKPGGELSRFPKNAKRICDGKLREAILNQPIVDKASAMDIKIKFSKPVLLPKAFQTALKSNKKIAQTWRQERTDLSDGSRSTHDLSLCALSIKKGITRAEDLASIIYNAPYNKTKWEERGPRHTTEYINATVSKALSSILTTPYSSEESSEKPHSKSNKKGMALRNDNSHPTYRFDDLCYVIRTQKKHPEGITATILIKTASGETLFTDNISLWKSRSRKSFAKAICEDHKYLKPVAITRHLVELNEKLIDEKTGKSTSKKAESKYTKENRLTKKDKQTAIQELKRPDLLDNIVKNMTEMGHVGEDVGKKLMYLVATSRKSTKPLHLLIQARSAAGKSHLGDILFELIPKTDVIDVTSFSEQAIAYAGENYFKGKLVRVAEHIDSDDNDTVYYYFRELLSKGEVCRIATTKRETGSLSAETVVAKGPIAYIETTTKAKIHEENATRMFTYRVDESRRQTRHIHEAQRIAYTEEGIIQKKQRHRIKEKHHMMQNALKELSVIIPYAKEIEFPTELRTRRDHDRFLSLIQTSALLHQYQRPIKKIGSEDYIVANGKDYSVAFEISQRILADSISDIPPAAKELYQELKGLQEKDKLKSIFSKKNIKEQLGRDWSESRIYTNLRHLIVHEWVKSVSESRGKIGGKYRLQTPTDMGEINIPTLSELTIRRMRKPGFWKHSVSA